MKSRELEQLIARHLPSAFPALSICVMHQGKTILHEAWGWIDPERRQLPVKPETLFDLASVSKLIVETSFLVLVEAGAIGLDSRLVDVLPEFARLSPRGMGAGQDPHTRRFLPFPTRLRRETVEPAAVTFKHLLTHRSGLPAWRSVYLSAGERPPSAPAAGDGYEAERWRRGLDAMLDFPFAGNVGGEILYSDIGIMLLGEAVARLQGARLDKALDALVLRPLHLSTFTYNPVATGRPRENIAPTEMDRHWRGRRAWGEVHDENACGVGGIAGHAGLFATAEDVARFGQAWLSNDPRLQISPQLRAAATSEQASGGMRLGLGWMLKAERDSSAGDLFSATSYGHTGFTGTSLWIDPERELACAVLSNRVYHGRQEAGIHAFRRAIHDLIVREFASA